MGATRRAATVPMAMLVGAVLAVVPASTAHAATWSVTTTPNISPSWNSFTAIDALSATNVWAVGHAQGTTERALAARWNGSSWTLATPPVPSTGSALHGVDGSSASNVWAVGSSFTAAPLTQRWNGTTWSTVPSPSRADATNSVLTDVKTFGTTSAWAVGQVSVSTCCPFHRTLIQRWDGASWRIVPSPSPDPTQNVLVAVDGVSSSNVWAVGGIGHDGYEGRTTAGLVLHWNGSSWTRAAIPGSDSTFSTIELNDVMALATNDVWVVGRAFHRQLFREVPYLLRWNGQTWKQTTIPNPPAGWFTGVTALSPAKVYAVGQTIASRTLIARWNGSTWTRESTPSPGTYNGLTAAAATGTGTVWAVGLRGDSNLVFRTLAIRTSNG